MGDTHELDKRLNLLEAAVESLQSETEQLSEILLGTSRRQDAVSLSAMKLVEKWLLGYQHSLDRHKDSLCLTCKHAQLIESAPPTPKSEVPQRSIACGVVAPSLGVEKIVVMTCNLFRVDGALWKTYAQTHGLEDPPPVRGAKGPLPTSRRQT